MRVRVEIKKEHIEGATAGASNCVLARALGEIVGSKVLVGRGTWGRWQHDEGFDLPRSARELVRRFDEGAVIKPCAIFMDIPEEVLHAHHG